MWPRRSLGSGRPLRPSRALGPGWARFTGGPLRSFRACWPGRPRRPLWPDRAVGAPGHDPLVLLAVRRAPDNPQEALAALLAGDDRVLVARGSCRRPRQGGDSDERGHRGHDEPDDACVHAILPSFAVAEVVVAFVRRNQMSGSDTGPESRMVERRCGDFDALSSRGNARLSQNPVHMSLEPLSPELALVDSDLAARARAALPDAPYRPPGRRPTPSAPAEARAHHDEHRPGYPFWARVTAALWLLVLGILIGGAAIPHAQDQPRVIAPDEDAPAVICEIPETRPALPSGPRAPGGIR